MMDPGSIHSRRGIRVELDAEAIAAGVTGFTADDVAEQVVAALRAVRRNGGTTGCGDGLRDKREAEGLAERLEGALRGD